MGYDVHITRADCWLDGEEQPITLDDWLAYVRSDPEMRLDRLAEAATNGGELVEMAAPGLVVWTSYSTVPTVSPSRLVAPIDRGGDASWGGRMEERIGLGTIACHFNLGACGFVRDKGSGRLVGGHFYRTFLVGA